MKGKEAELILKTADGGTASLSELELDGELREALQGIRQMMRGTEELRVKLSPEAADAMLRTMAAETEIAAADFEAEWFDAYTMGRMGLNERIRNAVNRNDYLTDADIRNEAYRIGKNEGTPNAGAVRIGTAKLSANMKAQLTILDQVAADMGLRVTAVDRLYRNRAGETEGGAVWSARAGDYGGTDGNCIVLSLFTDETDANGNPAERENILLIAAGHEAVHWLRKQGGLGEAMYRHMAETVKNLMGETAWKKAID